MHDTPPPAKRLLRPRNIVLLSIALLAVWIGVEVFRALTAEPGSAIDYGAQAIELSETHQPAGRDGWELLLEAIGREDVVSATYRQAVLPEEGNEAAFIDYTLLYAFDPTAEGYKPHGPELTRRKTAMALEDVRKSGAFDKLAELAAAPRAVRPRQPGRMIEWLLPELGKCRNFARMNAARMYLATQGADARELIAAYEQSLALGRVCAAQPFLIDHLVGVAIVSLANTQLRYSLMERRWDAPTLNGILDAMDRQLPLPPVTLAIKGERLSTLDTIQWTHTDDGRGDGRLIVSEYRTLTMMGGEPPQIAGYTLPDTRLVNLFGVLYAGKAATTRKAEEFYEQSLVHAQTPAWRWGALASDPDQFAENLSHRYSLLRNITPSIGKAVQSRATSDLEAAGTRLMLAIELFRTEHGRHPEALSELVPSILPEMPRDPFTGGEFGYKRRGPDADPADPREYILYSWGADMTDNGGLANPTNPHTALRPNGQGTDYVINQPRPRPRSQGE